MECKFLEYSAVAENSESRIVYFYLTVAFKPENSENVTTVPEDGGNIVEFAVNGFGILGDVKTAIWPSRSTVECFHVERHVLFYVFLSWCLLLSILAIRMCAVVRVNIVYIPVTTVYIMNVYSHLSTFSKWYKKYSFQTSSLSRKVYGKMLIFSFHFSSLKVHNITAVGTQPEMKLLWLSHDFQ